MAQTFNDFIKECELYEHSKEHYDIMKECSELKLMGMYLSNQRYVKENADDFAGFTLTENFFESAANDDAIKQLTEAFDLKKNKIIKFIVDKFNALKKKILTLFAKLFGKFVEFKGIEDMNNFISKYSFTQEDLNIITGTYKTALQDKGIMITVDNRMRGIKFNVAGDVELTAETKSAVLITLGMVSKTGFIEATVGADKKVVEINVLLDVIAKANDLAKVDDPDLYLRIINEMDKQTSSQKKSIDFSKVKDIADKVEALQAAKDITEEDLKNLPDNTAEVAVNAITAINNAIAGTVEFYNNILGARKAFTTMYASIFGNKK